MRAFLAVIVVALAVAIAVPAASQDQPSSYGVARTGSLQVVSGVLVSPTAVDMRGVWTDEKVSCLKSRTLAVRAQITISPLSGKGLSRHYIRSGSFVDINCAEGGPNVGFTIRARAAKTACPNGRWKPAIYSFITTTTEPTKKLRARAILEWRQRSRC
jgi:hypothetical protein